MTQINAVTHGGRSRRFHWTLLSGQVLIENEAHLRHCFPLQEIIDVLHDLYAYFGTQWFPLANNVEKMYRGSERMGLGSMIYRRIPGDTFHAQGASYLGVVLEQVGILEWNGKARGIEWRIVSMPADLHTLRERFRRHDAMTNDYSK